MKLKAFFVIFKGLSLKQMKRILLRRWKSDFSPTGIPNSGVPCLKPMGDSKVESAFDPSEVDKMSTSNFWELCGK